MASFEERFYGLLHSLSKEEKRWLEDHRGGALPSLRFVKLEPNLLWAAVHSWQSDVHLFNFQGREVVPLPEELGAIAGVPSIDIPCIPNVSEFFYNSFGTYLGLGPYEIGLVVNGLNVDLLALLNCLAPDTPERKLYRRRTIFFCLFAHYLFRREDTSSCHASIITIVDQCERGRDPMPMVLGELLISLDRARAESGIPFVSCPELLQVGILILSFFLFSFCFSFLHTSFSNALSFFVGLVV